jgi:hypothetical protein
METLLFSLPRVKSRVSQSLDGKLNFPQTRQVSTGYTFYFGVVGGLIIFLKWVVPRYSRNGFDLKVTFCCSPIHLLSLPNPFLYLLTIIPQMIKE